MQLEIAIKRAASVSHQHLSTFFGEKTKIIFYRCLQKKRQKVFSVCSVAPPAAPNSKLKLQRVGARRPAKKKTHPARTRAEAFINFELGGAGGPKNFQTIS